MQGLQLERLPVREVSSGMAVEPNHVYVIPPKANMTLQGSRLTLTRRVSTGKPYMPADEFFESLARTRKHRAIGVVLSGTASDGTIGLRAIKAEGGITFAQDSGSARYDGMPRSAIAAGVVDFILSPEEIARELDRLDPVPGLRADLEAGPLEQLAQVEPDDRLVLGDQNPHTQQATRRQLLHASTLGNPTSLPFGASLSPKPARVGDAIVPRS